MARGFTDGDYWEAYGRLKPRSYVPTLALTGLARAMGIKEGSRAEAPLRAWIYLASHQVSGDRLAVDDPEDYTALCAFIQGNWLVDEDEGTLYGCKPEDVQVVSATQEQVGSMWPELTEATRRKKAARALERLIEARAIMQITEGRRGHAPLYAFLPIVFQMNDEDRVHWFGRWDMAFTDYTVFPDGSGPFGESPRVRMDRLSGGAVESFHDGE